MKLQEHDLAASSKDLILGGDPPDFQIPSPKLKISCERERALIPVAWNKGQDKTQQYFWGGSQRQTKRKALGHLRFVTPAVTPPQKIAILGQPN